MAPVQSQQIIDKCVVLCCDDNYLPFARTLIKDILAFSPNYPIYVLTPPKSQISKLSPYNDLVNFIEVDIGQHSKYLNEASHISIFTYARLFIPYFLPTNVSYFLYLDIDLILLSSLDEIFSLEPQYAFSLVPTESKAAHHPLLLKLNRIFYGGVMLVNTSLWKQANVTQRCIDIARSDGPFPNQDNDLLLLVSEELSFGELPAKFNTMFYEKDSSEISIVHFPGSEKPWNSFHGGKYARIWRKRYRSIEPSFRLGFSIFFQNYFTLFKNRLYAFVFKTW